MKENHIYCNFNYNAIALREVCGVYLLERNTTRSIVYNGIKESNLKQVADTLNISMPIYTMVYFRLDPYSIGGIHKDIKVNEDYTPKETNGDMSAFALNLPIINGAGICMNSYSELKQTKYITKANTPYLPEEDSNKLMTVIVNKPSIMKIDDWHRVENISGVASELISIRFPSYISRQQLIDYFN